MKELIKLIIGLWALVGCFYLPVWILKGIELLFDFKFSFDAGLMLCLLLVCSFLLLLIGLTEKFDKK